MAIKDYKHITLQDMMNYIDENAKQDKEWFKSVAMPDGKYQHLVAVRAFCARYMPEMLPKRKTPKANKSDILAKW